MWPVKSARKCKFFIWNRQNQDYCLFDKHEYELSYKTMGGPTFPDVRTCCWIDHGIENYQVMFYQHLLYATDFAKHMSLVGCHNLNKIELNWECIFERQLALLVALQGESIWKGGGGCWGDINLRRQKTGDKAIQTWIQALIIVIKA